MVCLCIPVIICGCSDAHSMIVQSKYGPGIKFDGLGHRYQWTSDISPVTGEGPVVNPQFHELLKVTVQSQLETKGFALVSDGQPDFWLSYRVARRQRRDPRLGDVEDGSLLLEITDTKTRQLIWLGSVRARINNSDTPKRRKTRINDAVKAILKQFPPA